MTTPYAFATGFASEHATAAPVDPKASDILARDIDTVTDLRNLS